MSLRLRGQRRLLDAKSDLQICRLSREEPKGPGPCLAHLGWGRKYEVSANNSLSEATSSTAVALLTDEVQ